MDRIRNGIEGRVKGGAGSRIGGRIKCPFWIGAAASLVRSSKGQGSLEYIMMVSAVSIIVVIALAMMMQLKGVALHSFYNGTNSSVAQSLSKELSNLTATQ